MDYLAIPFELREDYLHRCQNLEESIRFSVGLILSTRPGQMPFLPEYGCAVWEMEFTDIHTANKADIRASLRNAIARFEKRLYDVTVSFSHPETNAGSTLGLVVQVTGNYREDGEERRLTASYTLG